MRASIWVPNLQIIVHDTYVFIIKIVQINVPRPLQVFVALLNFWGWCLTVLQCLAVCKYLEVHWCLGYGWWALLIWEETDDRIRKIAKLSWRARCNSQVIPILVSQDRNKHFFMLRTQLSSDLALVAFLSKGVQLAHSLQCCSMLYPSEFDHLR